MSPRAAWRLEELGFERAYDFAGGKTAWIERGLPTEGTGPFLLVAGQVLRPATATCRPETRAGEVRAELEPGPDSICAVTNDHSIVVGRVRWKDLPEDDDVRVGGFMQLGPATVRPREELRDLVERMRAAGVKAILVTSEEGRLLGVVNRDDGERLVKEREGHSRAAESVT
ncbi:MAG: CBS domain-containing protein [Actinobacteria bacterium]|nr:MAG: CBS domain-containing protein [Actinomycetota bacterium]